MNKSLHGSGSRFGARSKASLLVCGLLLMLGASAVSAQSGTAPRGWNLAGDHPQNYTTGVDKGIVYRGHPSAYLKSKPSATEGFGTLMQQIDAAQYLGKRVRLSAWVKSEDVDDWSALWMRVDTGTTTVAFDNMENRPIKGTIGWQNYAVVLDVPKDATSISFGILLSRKGSVWLNSVRFEIVGTDVPVTDMSAAKQTQTSQGPTNLNFEE